MNNSYIRITYGETYRKMEVIPRAIWLVIVTELWIIGCLSLILADAPQPVLCLFGASLVIPWYVLYTGINHFSKLEKKLLCIWLVTLMTAVSVVFRTVIMYKYLSITRAEDPEVAIYALYAIQAYVYKITVGSIMVLLISLEFIGYALFNGHLNMSTITPSSILNCFTALKLGYTNRRPLRDASVIALESAVTGAFLGLIGVTAIGQAHLTMTVALLIAWVVITVYMVKRLFSNRINEPELNKGWNLFVRYFCVWYSFHAVFLNMIKWAWQLIKHSPMLKFKTSVFSFVAGIVYIVFIILLLLTTTAQLEHTNE